ncbi:MAG: hypothetical protein GY834_17170 [Bacteroidetes bacterium]|nr:hypothetical protein [Bacteroidota bacterium]
MELVVALSLTGLLLVVLIGANVFVHKLLMKWSQGNSLVEERVFILKELATGIAGCDSLVFDSSQQLLTCYFPNDSILYKLSDGILKKDSTTLNRNEFSIDFYKVSQDNFAYPDSSIILESVAQRKPTQSLYSVELSVSYRGKTDVSIKKIRNLMAFSKE